MMKTVNIVYRKWTIAIVAILYCLLSPFVVQTFAAFENTGTGARGAALGDTYVAVGDDILSLMYNPAGLAQVHTKEVTSEYSRLFTGLTDGSNLSQSYLGYGQPIRWGGTMSFGWKQLSLDNLYTERTLSPFLIVAVEPFCKVY